MGWFIRWLAAKELALAWEAGRYAGMQLCINTIRKQASTPGTESYKHRDTLMAAARGLAEAAEDIRP